MLSALLALAGVAVLVAALIWSTNRQVGVVLRTFESQERPESAPYDDEWIRSALDDLTLAVAEGIEHADRSERRVRAVVQGAKRRMEAAGYDDPGVEAEADQLSSEDAASRRPEVVQPLPENVEPDWVGTAWAAVPGIENA